MREEIARIVFTVIGEIAEEVGEDRLQNATEETHLFELLDSMAVLDFILAVEEGIQVNYGRYVQIADEKSMDASQTPFKTVGSAIDFITAKVNSDG